METIAIGKYVKLQFEIGDYSECKIDTDDINLGLTLAIGVEIYKEKSDIEG